MGRRITVTVQLGKAKTSCNLDPSVTSDLTESRERVHWKLSSLGRKLSICKEEMRGSTGVYRVNRPEKKIKKKKTVESEDCRTAVKV